LVAARGIGKREAMTKLAVLKAKKRAVRKVRKLARKKPK
jgi:hypothetical protein